VDPAVTRDISPNGFGNNGLGDDDGEGYDVNPVTGSPYTPQLVPAGDFHRVLAEYWADGPNSETPPGHWNTIANEVSDDPVLERRLFGDGDELDRLEWDVKLYLALNGAVHDAAIVAWELEREYTSARPITLIRAMAQRGQSSDPDGPSFDPDGLPLTPGLIEVIPEESAAPGERPHHLRHFGAMLHAPDLRRLTRRSVAGGVALGLFVGFVPLPFQMVIAAAAALLIRVNLPIAVIAVWVTNPFTIPPIIYVAHRIGTWVLDTPVGPVDVDTSFAWLLHQTGRAWKPIVVGCLFLGTFASVLGYAAVRLAWRAWVIQQWWKRRRGRHEDAVR